MTKVELTLLERLRRGFQLSGFTAFLKGLHITYPMRGNIVAWKKRLAGQSK
jgi:hypothetical protein